MDVLTADKWIYATLKASSTLNAQIGGSSNPRIYGELAPSSATYPLIILKQMSARPVLGVGSSLIMFNEIWLVKAVDKATTETALGAILNAVRTSLHKASGTATGGVIIGCTEEGSVRYSEAVAGIIYKHFGLTFRLYSQ